MEAHGGVGSWLETVDLVIVERSTTPKARDACIDWRWPRAPKEDGIGRGRAGGAPLGKPRNIGVAVVQEGFIARLNLLS